MWRSSRYMRSQRAWDGANQAEMQICKWTTEGEGEIIL